MESNHCMHHLFLFMFWVLSIVLWLIIDNNYIGMPTMPSFQIYNEPIITKTRIKPTNTISEETPKMIKTPITSKFVQEHGQTDYFSARRNLVQFACKHSVKIFLDAITYNHQVCRIQHREFKRVFVNIIGATRTPT